ncbi:MAG TPA: hypothetical protein VGE18_00735 [Candidatus Paceibacterota bacterium]
MNFVAIVFFAVLISLALLYWFTREKQTTKRRVRVLKSSTPNPTKQSRSDRTNTSQKSWASNWRKLTRFIPVLIIGAVIYFLLHLIFGKDSSEPGMSLGWNAIILIALFLSVIGIFIFFKMKKMGKTLSKPSWLSFSFKRSAGKKHITDWVVKPFLWISLIVLTLCNLDIIRHQFVAFFTHDDHPTTTVVQAPVTTPACTTCSVEDPLGKYDNVDYGGYSFTAGTTAKVELVYGQNYYFVPRSPGVYLLEFAHAFDKDIFFTQQITCAPDGSISYSYPVKSDKARCDGWYTITPRQTATLDLKEYEVEKVTL